MTNLLKYCPKCGAKRLKKRSKSDSYHCPNCRFLFYRSPAPSVGAIIVKKKQILLTKRAIKPYLNHWDIPGGYINAEETPEQTLKREIKEKLGTDITVGKLIAVIPDYYGPTGWPTLNFFYLTKLFSNQLKPKDDISEAKWFKTSQLPAKVAFKNSKEVLKIVQKKYG